MRVLNEVCALGNTGVSPKSKALSLLIEVFVKEVLAFGIKLCRAHQVPS